MIYVFTSAAWNYLPKSHLLAKSVKKYLPDSRMILGLPDKMTDDVDYRKYDFDEIIPLSEDLINLPNHTGWIYSHTIVELATAIKPFILCQLLTRKDCEAVLYFDPDIMLFSPMDDMLAEFKNSSILLCPHVTQPEVNYQSIIDNELGSLKYGVFNFGYVGVKNSPDGRACAEWWRDRCGTWCYDDIPNGVFTDQKWSDLVPCLFDSVKVLRSPRFDVATWNTTRRAFTGSLEKGFKVNGEPLGFYHFTGFDSGAHDVMLDRALAPAVQMQLTAWYKQEHVKASQDPLCQRPWAFMNYSDGTAIPAKHRAYFRNDRDVQNFFRDPFDVTCNANNYRNWYGRNIEGTPQDPDMRPDVQIVNLREELQGKSSEIVALKEELKTARYLYERKVWEHKEARREADGLRQEMSSQIALREKLERSLSWRITAPLRSLSRFISKIKGK